MRERMVQHRANPVCASCHAMMDPAGFALENFDAVGRWRTRGESFAPIDASGETPDGTRFDGAAGLRAALLSRSELFVGDADREADDLCARPWTRGQRRPGRPRTSCDAPESTTIDFPRC